MSRLVDLYHRLPYPARVAAASAWGVYLQSWRYGAETDRLAAEAAERESWTRALWDAWREQRLAYILERAATRVPYYRERWAERRRLGDRSSWARLSNWPVLSKEEVRRQPRAFIADDCEPRRMMAEHTSGTTGTPLSLWITRRTAVAWYALVERRMREWNGVTRRSRWANVGGRLVAAFDESRPPFWVWNAGMRQLYLSSYHLSDRHIPAYLEALERHRVSYLLGYASSLYALARFVLDRGLAPPPLRVVISNAEPLLGYQRETIEHAFRSPVRNTYGMSELVCGASECAEGALHSWPEAGLVEVLEDDSEREVEPGGIGRLVCTSLLNADMPLVRYAVGDRGGFAAAAACPCGRTLPIFQEIEGREDDVIVTADGRRIGRLDPVFKAELPVIEAQIVQLDRNRIRVRLVPAPGFTERHERRIREALRERVGGMEIEVERVGAIERAPNGKFRAVIGLGSSNDAGPATR